MKNELILHIENLLKNYVLKPAVEKAFIGGPLYTSRDVWGAEVICCKHIEDEKWEKTSYKLHNYYTPIEFTENDIWFLVDHLSKELIDCVSNMVAQEIRKQNIKMFGGKKFLDLPLTEKNEYICYQLCDWQWLIDEDGIILHKKKNENGDVVYLAMLVKYAVVVDKDGEEVDQ